MNDSCKGCTRRHVGCHSNCEDYAEFRRQIEKRNHNRNMYENDRGRMFINMKNAARNFKNNSKVMKKNYVRGV